MNFETPPCHDPRFPLPTVVSNTHALAAQREPRVCVQALELEGLNPENLECVGPRLHVGRKDSAAAKGTALRVLRVQLAVSNWRSAEKCPTYKKLSGAC